MCVSILLEGSSIFLASQVQAEKIVGAHSRIFYRHAKIDHRQFFRLFISFLYHLIRSFSLFDCRTKEWKNEEARMRRDGRGSAMVRMSIDDPSRVGETPRLFPSRISHRIVSDTGDLYLPPRPTTFSADWAHCPARRSWLRDALTSRIESAKCASTKSRAHGWSPFHGRSKIHYAYV